MGGTAVRRYGKPKLAALAVCFTNGGLCQSITIPPAYRAKAVKYSIRLTSMKTIVFMVGRKEQRPHPKTRPRSSLLRSFATLAQSER